MVGSPEDLEMLRGVFTAIVTPFRADGIDWDALAALVEDQIEAGIHGLVPCGTTGESATLTVVEHDEVIRFVVDRVRGRIPVVAGAGSNSTAEAVSRTHHAKEVGADAALHILPYYNRPSQAGILAHFRAIAAVGLPTMVYNIPGRTGVALTLDTYEELAEIPGIVATKEATGTLEMADRVLAATDLLVFSGDDALTYPLLGLGGHGVVSVVSNVVPRLMVDLYDYMVEGKLVEAREIHVRLRPLIDALFADSNPGPVKAAMAHLGQLEEILRLPLVRVGPEVRELVIEQLQRLDS